MRGKDGSADTEKRGQIRGGGYIYIYRYVRGRRVYVCVYVRGGAWSVQTHAVQWHIMSIAIMTDEIER